MTNCPPAVEELQLLLQNDMWELWVIDRANGPTDQAHFLFTAPGKLELVLEHLANGRAHVLPTALFPLVDYQSLLPLQSNIPSGDCILPIALDLGVLGGHYAICYAHGGKVEVFDSMVSSQGAGVYTPTFLTIAQAYFPREQVIMIQPSPGEDSLQPTGGFSWITPPYLEGGEVDKPTMDLLRLCNPQAQDHFCWAWCLLYVHSRLEGYELTTTRQWLARTRFPPVALIKTYVWLLASWLGMQLPIEYHRDFLSIWDATNRLDPVNYRRYWIRMQPEPYRLRSARECLEYVLPPTTVTLVREEMRESIPVECQV